MLLSRLGKVFHKMLKVCIVARWSSSKLDLHVPDIFLRKRIITYSGVVEGHRTQNTVSHLHHAS